MVKSEILLKPRMPVEINDLRIPGPDIRVASARNLKPGEFVGPIQETSSCLHLKSLF